jgi:hypothetical protein
MQSTTSKVEIRDVTTGLWIWRAPHPQWNPGKDWKPLVTSTYVESGGERLVIDPLAPKAGAEELWKRLDNRPPTVGVVTIPDHARDIDEFVRRYNVRGFGPNFYSPYDDIPKSKLGIIMPDSVLPGGVVALYDGRGFVETPLWLPEQRVIVFGDALWEKAGELRIRYTPWHEKRALPALRELLDLPFERVIVSHAENEPVQPRAAYENALKLPPYKSPG